VGPKSNVPGGCDEQSEERPLRADALRNRGRILEAAEIIFACEGIEAPVDVIAEKAGVGVGTLYRHFPTKEKLCEAILLERLRGLTEDARAQADAPDPAAAFFGFLEHFVTLAESKRDLVAAVMGAGVDFDKTAAPVKEDLREAVDVLLRRAQELGAVRLDVSSAAVVSLVGATCHAAAGHGDGAPAFDLLTIVCDGLRAPAP
jgi:AcrR family transcriptional regulator